VIALVLTFVLAASEPLTVTLVWPVGLDCPSREEIAASLETLGMRLTNDGVTAVDARVLKDGVIEIVVTTGGRGGTRAIEPDGTCTEIAFRVSAAIDRLARPLGEPLVREEEAPPPEPPPLPAPAPPPPPPTEVPEPVCGLGAALTVTLGNELRLRPGLDVSFTQRTQALVDWRLRASVRWPHRESFAGGEVTAHEILLAAGIRGGDELAWGATLLGQMIAANGSGFANDRSGVRFNPGLSAEICDPPGSWPVELCARIWGFARAQELAIDGEAAMTLPRFGVDLTIGTLLWF